MVGSPAQYARAVGNDLENRAAIRTFLGSVQECLVDLDLHLLATGGTLNAYW